MRFANRIAGLAFALSVVACGKTEQTNSLVVVNVAAPAGAPTVTQLRVLVTNAGASQTKMFPESPVASGIKFDTSFALSLPLSRNGNLVLAIAALGTASEVVATADVTVAIVAGGRADATVTLNLVSGADAGIASPDALRTDTKPDGPGAFEVTPPHADASGTGGRPGTGGINGTTATGGATTVLGTGGAVVTTSGQGGTVDPGSGGTTNAPGHGGSGGATTPGSGALTSYTFPASSEPCEPAKDVSGGQSGNLGTKGAFCFRTADDFNAYGCNNIEGRTLKINGTEITTCGGKPPAKLGSFYYFDFGAGTYDYAGVNWYCASAAACTGPHPVPPCGHYPPWQPGATAAPCADTTP